MNKKRIVINLIGLIYIAILTVFYFTESIPFLTTGFSGFIIFLIGLCMALYTPKVGEDIKKFFKLSKQ